MGSWEKDDDGGEKRYPNGWIIIWFGDMAHPQLIESADFFVPVMSHELHKKVLDAEPPCRRNLEGLRPLGVCRREVPNQLPGRGVEPHGEVWQTVSFWMALPALNGEVLDARAAEEGVSFTILRSPLGLYSCGG